MSYITEQGLRDRFNDQEIDQLIDADPTAIPPDAGDTEKLARAISDADSLIDVTWPRKAYFGPLDATLAQAGLMLVTNQEVADGI